MWTNQSLYSNTKDLSIWENVLIFHFAISCLVATIFAISVKTIFEKFCKIVLGVDTSLEKYNLISGLVTLSGAVLGMVLTLYFLVKL